MNPHSNFIDKRLKDLEKLGKFNVNIVNTSHKDFIRSFRDCVFTNFTHQAFTNTYVSKQRCADCGGKATERCHEIGRERHLIIEDVLKKIWPDTSIPINLNTITLEYLRMHKDTKFALKCKLCHKKEKIGFIE